MTLLELLVRELPKRGGWPEGATHIAQGGYGNLFYRLARNNKMTDMGIKLAISTDYYLCEVTREQYEAAITASQPQWNGEGLPPVGCECEWLDKNTQKWFPVLIKYQSSWVIGIQEIKDGEEDPVELSIDVLTDKERCKFRPIRSEADEKRQEAVQAMCDFKGNGVKCDESAGWGKAWYELYDAIAAGEIPHIKLSD